MSTPLTNRYWKLKLNTHKQLGYKIILYSLIHGAMGNLLCWYPFAQRLHVSPVTPSLHGHWPVVWLQVFPRAPTGWQSHPRRSQKFMVQIWSQFPVYNKHLWTNKYHMTKTAYESYIFSYNNILIIMSRIVKKVSLLIFINTLLKHMYSYGSTA